MPGPAMHHLIVDRLRAHLHRGGGLGRTLSAAEYAQLQALVSDPKHLPYLFFGCQGPDFLFFNAKDVDPTIGALVEFYYDVYEFIEDFKKTLLDAVPQPVLDALSAFDEAVDDVITDSALLSEIKQTFDDLNRLIDGFIATLTEMVKKFISEFNVFDVFQHPYRDGVPAGGSWWWFDALHYRQTGKFATALLDKTRDLNSPLHLYALGYLSHVAADTVGHPYVNAYCGGAYRSQSQRHKTGENFQDVWNLRGQTGVDWNRSKLHALYNFNFDGTVDDDEPDTHTRLPTDLAQLIADTINQVYDIDPTRAGAEFGKAITAEDVGDTYRTWYRWMKSATDSGTIPAPVSYSLTAELREVWEKALDNLGDAGDLIKNAADSAGDFGILSIFLILAALVVAAAMAAAALADAVAGAVATLGTSTLRYAACLIYEQLYDAFQNFRLGVALNGLAFPMTEHLTEPRFQQFVTPAVPDSTGMHAAIIAGAMPRLRWTVPFLSDPLGAIFSRERHLVYPVTAAEKGIVLAAPPSYLTQLPTFYAFGNLPLDPQTIDALAALSAQPSTEAQIAAVMAQGGLGNAVALTGHLYDRWRHGQRLPDFNLDADRGFGYLCWTQIAGTPDPPDFPTRLVTNTSAADPTTVRLQTLP